ncbi:MAG: hypothetical protein RIQ79_2301 [Verrucomicrobiota bacterium]
MDASVTREKSLLGFGDGAGLAVPVLGGEARETLFGGLARAGRAGGFALHASADWLVGVRVEPITERLGARTEALYAELLEVCAARGREVARIWNYVPGINEVGAEAMEAYRVFCLGRAAGFERAGWRGPVPAASAVGGPEGMIGVMFAAARERPEAMENPDQVPAYEYPPEHGPRSPSFSRAMRVRADGRRWTFVSGTAAIKGHATVAADSLAGQIDCTLDNLRLISGACGLGGDLGAERAAERHFKVYLRHAGDLAATRAALVGRLLRPEDRVTWLRSDICRAALKLEIEATVIEQVAAD